MAEPAVETVAVAAYIVEDGDRFAETNVAGRGRPESAAGRRRKILAESYCLLVLLHVVVVLFLEKFFVPLELFQEQ